MYGGFAFLDHSLLLHSHDFRRLYFSHFITMKDIAILAGIMI